MWWGRQVNINSLRNYWQAGREGLNQYHFNYAWNDNPFFTSYENTNPFKRNRFFGNIALTVNFTKNLSLLARTGIDFLYEQRESLRAFSSQLFPTGAYKLENLSSFLQNTDLILSYDKTIYNNWSLKTLLGANLIKEEKDYQGSFANGLYIAGVYNLKNSSSAVEELPFSSQKKTNGLYFSGELSYKNMIYVNLTGRNDWSSSLANPNGNNKFSYFYPSISSTFLLSKALQLPKGISYWSLRAGYAEVGNDTEPYRLQNTYVYSQPYGSTGGVELPTKLANKNLKPERLKSIELGTELRFYKNKIGIDLAYYNSQNSNQLIQVPTSFTSGFDSRFVNAGVVQNQGLEATLNTKVFAENFKWSFITNFSTNWSKVIEINKDYDQYIYSYTAVYSSDEARVFAIARKGGRMGDLYGTGLLKNEEGKLIVDDSGLPITDNKLRKLGNYNPDFIMGFQNNLSYKNFNLGLLVEFRQGGVFVSRTIGIGIESGVLDITENRNPENLIVDGVRADGTKNTIELNPRDYYRNLYRRFHEEQLTFSATNVKIRELSLAYSLPKSVVNSLGVNSISFTLAGRNLWMWTADQNHVDPESLSYEGSQGTLTPGVEELNSPPVRSYGLRLDLKF
ncbi:MAG: hypothetical protein ACK5H1_02020 [Tenacibaculum sp.]